MKLGALSPTVDALLSPGPRRGALFVWCLLGCPNLHAQQLDRLEVEAILVESVHFVLDSQTPGKYTNPVLWGAGITRDLAVAQELDPRGLTIVVSDRTGIPVWGGDEEKFCDLSGRTPHWRMKNADFRLSVYLKQVSGDTALVSVSLSGSPSLAGTTGRTLELRHTSGAWSGTGYVGTVIHGTSTPCEPSPLTLPSADLASVLAAGLLGLVEDLPDSHPGGPVRYVCLADPAAGWDEAAQEAAAIELRRRGILVSSECVDPQAGGLEGMRTPGGEPAAEVELGKATVHRDTIVTIPLDTRVGTRSGTCELYPLFPCRQTCAIGRNDGVWSLMSCNVSSIVGGLK